MEGSRQARLCALPPRLLPPPAGLPPHPPPQLCSCRGRGSGACGAGSGGLPSPPRLLLGGGAGLGQSREGTGKWGFQSISGVGPQPSLHPDLLTQ